MEALMWKLNVRSLMSQNKKRPLFPMTVVQLEVVRAASEIAPAG